MIAKRDFVEAVRRIADSRPTYRTGGSGADGTCDCIGLIMGATGEEYPMHSTNYFSRYEMESMTALNSEKQLGIGDAVYKARKDGGQLHERYKPGGRYYTGDMQDYYHVGVVTGVDPLVITHCTEYDGVNGIAYDYGIKGWTHFGRIGDVIYGTEDANVKYNAYVVANSGNSVNMRSKPNKNGTVISRVPVGSEVVVNESAQGWSQVSFGGKTGYMMEEFLQIDQPKEETIQTFEQEVLSKLDAIYDAVRRDNGGA